jgi:hypothetical protein
MNKSGPHPVATSISVTRLHNYHLFEISSQRLSATLALPAKSVGTSTAECLSIIEEARASWPLYGLILVSSPRCQQAVDKLPAVFETRRDSKLAHPDRLQSVPHNNYSRAE